MKISMILTSLLVAISATTLTACDDYQDKPDVMEQTQEMKDNATDAAEPTPPPTE